MDGISLPYLPPSLWVIAAALTILLLFVVFGFYIYWRKRQSALLEDYGDAASLAAKKQILQADMEAIRQWLEDQKVEVERLGAEREEQERLRALLADLEQQCATKDHENQSLRNEVGEMENQRHNLTQTMDKLSQEIGDLEGKREEAKSIKERLAELRNKYKESINMVRNIAEEKANLEVLSNKTASVKRTLEDMQTAADLASTEAKQLKQESNEARIEAEKIIGDLRGFRKEKAELDVILETLRREEHALERQVERLEQRIDEFKDSSQSAKEDAKKCDNLAKMAQEESEKEVRKLEDIQRDKQRLQIELSELSARKAILEQEVIRLEGSINGRPSKDEDALTAYKDLLQRPPACLVKNKFKDELENYDESTLLQQLKNNLQKEGLVFSSRVIDAFHTSLKCHDINPITVLAGVSGTGKTLLPMRYASMMGMHRLVMAVQPRWDSPQDMFGFYNYLEKEYKATELSRTLVRMDPYNYNDDKFSMLDSNWARQRLLLVLLDEMNLARTEYYFSEFLSKLELRREVKNPSDPYDRSQAEIELDVGPGADPFRLWVERNVFFVGTLNEDETTQTLSDKVLDRANVIRFGKPDEKARAVKNNSQIQATREKYLSFNQWSSWHREFDEGTDWYENVINWIRRLNAALDRVGRPFGFRVQQAIGQYVANYPNVDDMERYKLAFADQIEQKIIPKLRGIDLGDVNANICLSDLEAVIADLGDEGLGDAFNTARTESEHLGMFQWRGVTRRVY